MTAEILPVIYIVDDDASVRKGLGRLIRSAGYSVKTFSSAGEFLASSDPDGPACLVLDVSMPGINGLELQETVNSLESHQIPIIFITGHGDIPMSVKAMKAGAVDFLTKPFNDNELFKAIVAALKKDIKNRETLARASTIKQNIDTLTPREHEVFALVVTGMLNKQIAGRLGIAEKTVKVHRGRVMQKMQAGSVAELVRLAQDFGKF
ncbi:MAG: response regulator transcription factor [Chitinivibrionales bacterium]|nr:response regulator transcription factor [Chitinivibrionales bacterium]